MEENVESFEQRPMQNAGIKRYQRMWFNNVLSHIENEQKKIIKGEAGTDRSVYQSQ